MLLDISYFFIIVLQQGDGTKQFCYMEQPVSHPSLLVGTAPGVSPCSGCWCFETSGVKHRFVHQAPVKCLATRPALKKSVDSQSLCGLSEVTTCDVQVCKKPAKETCKRVLVERSLLVPRPLSHQDCAFYFDFKDSDGAKLLGGISRAVE